MKKSLRTLLATSVTTVALGASMFTPGLVDQAHAVNYPRSAYGANPNVGVNPNAQNGWGSAQWPNCPTSAQLGTAVSRSGDRVTVRKELVPLVSELMNRTESMGYALDPATTGGFNCRSIRGSNQPSNHSRGRAVDINWNRNPMSTTFRSDIPPAVVRMWETHGFYWGGRYSTRYDTMHFEYFGTPASVAVNLRKLTGQPPADSCKDSTTTVKQGSRGEAVKDAQCLLNRKGNYGLVVDGIFGARTHSAVVSFQRSRGLVADGIVGPRTWAALKA
ncbi:MAG: M15 family metallopeptidase [Propionibacteriaceae bacterium]|nr:M15 family metallopeptidase [Propionibacteriaceae bacterium]